MESIAFRITRPTEQFEVLFKELSLVSRKLIIYEHNDTKQVHFHGLIIDCSINMLSVKRRFDKITKLKKTEWSFKCKEITEEFITYMSKGKLTPSFVHGYDDDQVKAFTQRWVQYNKQKQTLLATPLQLKATQKQIIQEIITLMNTAYQPHELSFLAPKQVDFVIENLILKLNQHQIVLGRFKFRDIIDTVMRNTHPEAYASKMSTLYFDRF